MFRIDLHNHTSYGSACSYMTPDELIQRAKLMGLDGICITEHNQLWSEEMLEKWRRKHNFLVLGGVAVLALMALATGNVCFRVFGMPYRGAYELVAFLGAVVTAFALGYTQRKKSHIVVDILTETFRPAKSICPWVFLASNYRIS